MKNISVLKTLNIEPVLVLRHEALEAIKYIVSIAPQEAQWFHTVTPTTREDAPGKVFLNLSTRLFIPKQNTSAAQVDSTSTMMIDFYNELKSSYTPADLNEVLSSMTCWCHSHHNMSPSPSIQDDSQFNSFIDMSKEQAQNNWQIMLIFNKKGQFYSRVYDPDTGLVFEGVEIQVSTNYDLTYIKEAAKQKFIAPKQISKWGNKSTFSNLAQVFSKNPLTDTSSFLGTNDFEDWGFVADSIIFELFPNKTLTESVRVFSPETAKEFFDTLCSHLDPKELNILLYLLKNEDREVLTIFTDKRFLKSGLSDSQVMQAFVEYFLNTTNTLNTFKNTLTLLLDLTDLTTLKECKEFLGI
jgi:hypothetical protein